MLLSAIVFGLISSLHCVGMCGPIAMVLPLSNTSKIRKSTQIVTYHLGRLSAYSFLGLIFGVFGKGLFLAGLQQQLSIIVGILMIVFVIVPQNKIGKLRFLTPFYRLVNVIKIKLGLQFKKKSNASLYVIGLFNGFLPCGMVYVALFGALSTQAIGLGALYMFLFGLGTIPLMTSIIYIRDFFSPRVRNTIMKYYPIIIVLFGILFIIRGLGLDIPFMSPDTLNLFVRGEANC